jgi:GTP-binding protein
MFVDEVKIYAKAGHGGKGCVAFHREAFIPKGGPSGGNGGRGGHVILQADKDINNLVDQYYKPRLIAQRGQNGMGKGMDGKAGKDLIVKVPCGTIVWKVLPDEPKPNPEELTVEKEKVTTSLTQQIQTLPTTCQSRQPLPLSNDLVKANIAPQETLNPLYARKPANNVIFFADLTFHGQEITLCKGGRGGLGNKNFATPTRQAPRFAQPGEPGEEGFFILELRLLGDVGLVGYPNAGKSTLLQAISNAHPKIAPYPFTTLHPQVGIVEYPDFFRLTVCDIPGLIAGAHKNIGLGHAFLRHIERCKVLVIIVDISGSEGRKPWDDYNLILEELRLFNPKLLEKPRLVAANKIDEPTAQSFLRKFKLRLPSESILPISAAFGIKIDKFKKEIRKLVENNPVSSSKI